MTDTGNSLRVKVVSLGIAAALSATAVLAQQRDPSPIERDRAAIAEQELDGDADRAAQADAQDARKEAEERAARSAADARAAQADAHAAEDLQRQAERAAGDGGLEAKPRSDAADGAATFAAIANERGDLGTFIAALEATGLDDTLASGTQYTVFAPTNEAFAMLGQSTEELLDPDNREELVALLRAHIVADDVNAELVRNLGEALTVDGGKLALSSHGEALMVGDARIVRMDVARGNLRVYGIDKVQEPNAPADVAAASLRGRDDPIAAAQGNRGRPSN